MCCPLIDGFEHLSEGQVVQLTLLISPISQRSSCVYYASSSSQLLVCRPPSSCTAGVSAHPAKHTPSRRSQHYIVRVTWATGSRTEVCRRCHCLKQNKLFITNSLISKFRRGIHIRMPFFFTPKPSGNISARLVCNLWSLLFSYIFGRQVLTYK